MIRGKNIFILGGGLGNQLFQYSAARSVLGIENVLFNHSIFNAWTDSSSTPEIVTFLALDNYKTTNSEIRASQFLKRLVGFGVMINLDPSGFRRNFVFRKFVNLACSIFLSLYFRGFYAFIAIDNYSFASTVPSFKGKIFAGYFQSYIWLDRNNTNEFLQSATILNPGPELKSLRKLASEEDPIFIHLRLGDYVGNKWFGVLPQTYYVEAIEQLNRDGHIGKFWVFSDDLKSAKKYLSHISALKDARWIGNVDNSTSSTLDLLRYGRAYVLGNSTFSWWGAYLSHTPDAPVIAPRPWLKGTMTPDNFYLPHWKILERDFTA